jgi:hypothetical protein
MTLPKDVQQSYLNLSGWLDRIGALSAAQVRAEFGEPDAQTDWGHEGTGGPRWEYRIDDRTAVWLFICRGFVASAVVHTEAKFYD